MFKYRYANVTDNYRTSAFRFSHIVCGTSLKVSASAVVTTLEVNMRVAGVVDIYIEDDSCRDSFEALFR